MWLHHVDTCNYQIHTTGNQKSTMHADDLHTITVLQYNKIQAIFLVKMIEIQDVEFSLLVQHQTFFPNICRYSCYSPYLQEAYTD